VAVRKPFAFTDGKYLPVTKISLNSANEPETRLQRKNRLPQV
jgi:hypothetical protein